MKRLGLSAVLLTHAFAVYAAPRVPEISVIPAPAQIEALRGSFKVEPETVLVVSDAPEAVATAHYFGDLMFRTHGFRTQVAAAASGRIPDNVIQFTLSTSSAASDPESYQLEISSDGVQLAATDPRGLFYGAVTLWQILTAEGAREDSVRAPGVRIIDAPRLRRRGLMLDSVSQYQSVDFIKGFIDAMALHKLNVLHWRLAGDAAWRVEIAKYPKLTSAAGGSASRPRTFYTQEEVRDIVRYAAARHVTIVPGLDMPAHATAAIVAYPQFGAPAATGSSGAALTHLLNIDEPTFAFIAGVLTELASLFPAEHVYLGCDSSLEQWSEAPKVAARMRQLGLDSAIEVQRYFTMRVADLLQEGGRRLSGSDGVMIGGDADGTLVVSGRGLDSALGAVSAGYEVVVSDARLDLSQRQAPVVNGRQAAGELVRVEDVYSFDPAPAVLSPIYRSRLIGVEASLWTDMAASEEDIQVMAFPRAAALAEVAWSAPERLQWARFQRDLPAQLARYRSLGIHHSDAIFKVLIIPRESLAHGRIRVELSKQAPLGDIRYTTNGAEPTPSSTAYIDVFEVAPPAVVKAAAFRDGAALAPAVTLLIEGSEAIVLSR